MNSKIHNETFHILLSFLVYRIITCCNRNIATKYSIHLKLQMNKSFIIPMSKLVNAIPVRIIIAKGNTNKKKKQGIKRNIFLYGSLPQNR